MFTPSFMSTSSQEIQWLDRVEKLFLRFGIKSITMDDVAADLGISKKTLYQMVESKDDLVIKVLEYHISREKSQCLHLAGQAGNAIDETFIILDFNSQELAQMKTNIVNDLQKYHHQAWEMIRTFQYDFVFKVIKANLLRGRQRASTVKISTWISLPGFISQPLSPCLIHSYFRMMPPQGLRSLKNICCIISMVLFPQRLAYLKKKLS